MPREVKRAILKRPSGSHDDKGSPKALGAASNPSLCVTRTVGESSDHSGRRVLLTGASGLLGRQVMRVFTEKGWQIRGLAFSRATGLLVKCDIFKKEELAAQFEEFRPNIVIHCAAERRPDKLEGNAEYAMKLNAEASRTIAEVAQAHGAWLVYLSTNYVFDGKDAPYAEDARPNPLMVYGVSKLMGEREVAQVHSGAAVLRVPLLYGPIEKLQETSVTALLETVRKGPCKLDNWQERYPTNVEDLALVLEAMASAYAGHSVAEPEAFSGVFHWQAQERHTKYTMGVIIAEIAGLDPAKITPIDAAPPPEFGRPQFERMLCTRLERMLGLASGSETFRSDFRTSMHRHLLPFLDQAFNNEAAPQSPVKLNEGV